VTAARRRGLAGALVLGLAMALGTTPAPAAPPLSPLDRKILETATIVDDPEIVAYLDEITARLHAARRTGAGPLLVTVIGDDTPNAFTTGAGRLYFFTGLLKLMRSEAELAMVIAHEIAHVDLQHIDQRKKFGAMTRSLSESPSVFAKLLQRGGGAAFGRMQERMADLQGLQYLAAAGYDTQAGAQAFQRMRAVSRATPGTLWTKTHPLSGERLFVLSRLSRRLPGGPRVGVEDYQVRLLNRLR
jgi:predicted Zn-dependent protease